MFPLIHMGRIWLAFFNLPYPNTRGPVWPNFNSALMWDVFAISTYFSVSLMFWYTGLIPDIATIRDRAKTKISKLFYGFFSFGWVGSAKHWQRHEALSLVLAGISTPLVLSVHTIVSFDFATSVIPGWHTTIFPPYFVSGAIFSGFAMVLTLMLITRKVLNLQEYITLDHIESIEHLGFWLRRVAANLAIRRAQASVEPRRYVNVEVDTARSAEARLLRVLAAPPRPSQSTCTSMCLGERT